MSAGKTGLVAASLLFLISHCAAQEFDVVPLPKTTVETRVTIDGKVRKQETKDILGGFLLPFSTHPKLRGERPPFGHREEVSKERLTVLGREIEATRIDWLLKNPKDFANFDAERITFWVADEIKGPAFVVPMDHGPGIPLPASTVKFEHLPRGPYAGDPRGKRKTTVKGRLVASKEVALGAARSLAHVYDVEAETVAAKTRAEFWLCSDVPGNVYRAVITKTSAQLVQTYTIEVKAVGNEDVPRGLHKVPQGEFAIAIPKGWKVAPLEEKSEIVRLRPDAEEDKLNRVITVEMKPAAGKDTTAWGLALSDEQDQVVEINLGVGLADRATFTMYPLQGGKERIRSYTIGSVDRDRLYLIGHWHDGVCGVLQEGREAVAEIAQSWRWLKKKAK